MATFPYSEAELKQVGLLGDELSIRTLECFNLQTQLYESPDSPPSISSEARVFSEFGPSRFESLSYYNGITAGDDHPLLIYRSNYNTTSFKRPTGRFASLPVKSVHGVFNTPLNQGNIWVTVGLEIVNLIKARKISLTSVNPARFFTHPVEDGEEGSLGPVVIWIGVKPGTTSPEMAHDASQEILALLKSKGIEGIVVEWKESVLQRLAGRPLLPAVGNSDATQNVRRFLTPLHGVSLAAQDLDRDDVEGTLTLWFHENLGQDGKPSDKVFGVTTCHVLRKNTTVDYELRDGAPRSYVRICGNRRFDRGLNETTEEIANRGRAAEALTRELTTWRAKERTPESIEEVEHTEWNLAQEAKADIKLWAFLTDARLNWSHKNLDRNIGYTQFAPAITVDVEGGTRFISDWGAFVAAEGKVKDTFEGNVVYIGTKYAPRQLVKMLYPFGDVPPSYKLPEEGKFRIVGWSTLDELAIPDGTDSEHHRFVTVGKDGNASDLTIGQYAGLVSFTENDAGVTSIEIAIYNAGRKTADDFSEPGDSGALVWRMKNGEGYIVGQLHSGENKGGSSSNHVSYCTPGEKLLANIKAKFPHADFFRTTW
ncbi:hypothetical protein H0H81_012740 [Sphagnurus paluster]|uniref:Uncharacterized protein n=1 Tax=Sphagnurus paluster TaxID=117069 RepID=A0A9P7FN38_9AGAR|nr:hypothetical protein H0H81_012740 [Sphagnurus paluster]